MMRCETRTDSTPKIRSRHASVKNAGLCGGCEPPEMTGWGRKKTKVDDGWEKSEGDMFPEE